MNKNYKVVTINGIRGIIALIFIVLGLIAGFIISPGWVCMKIWNYIFESSDTVSLMNLFQGIMMWAIIALSLYALNNRRALIGFNSFSGLTPEQIRDIMARTKNADAKFVKHLEIMNKELKENVETDTVQQQEEQEEVRR